MTHEMRISGWPQHCGVHLQPTPVACLLHKAVQVQAGLAQPTQRAGIGLNCWQYRSRKVFFSPLSRHDKGSTLNSTGPVRSLPAYTNRDKQHAKGLTLTSTCTGRLCQPAQPACIVLIYSWHMSRQVSLSLHKQHAYIGLIVASTGPGRSSSAHSTSKQRVQLLTVQVQAGLSQPTQPAWIGLNYCIAIIYCRCRQVFPSLHNQNE